jgi:hypothetical protein
MEWAALNASIFVAIGGSAVSAAGYFDDRFRRPLLFAGVAMLICGLMLQFRLGRRSNLTFAYRMYSKPVIIFDWSSRDSRIWAK